MKEKIVYWLSSQKTNIENKLLLLLILFIPIQLGKHFWPDQAIIHGLRIDYLSPTLYLTDVIIVGLLILILATSFRKILHIFKPTRVLLVFLIVILLGIASSPSPLLGVYGLAKLVEYFFLGVVLKKWFEVRRNRELFPIALSVGVIFESILAMLQVYNQGSLQGVFYWFGERFFSLQTPGIASAIVQGQKILRPYGTFPHPNVLAGYLVIALTIIFFALILIRKRALSPRHQFFFFSSLAIGTVALFLTLSRVPIICWISILVLVTLRSFFEGSLKKGIQQVRVSKNKLFFVIVGVVGLSTVFIYQPILPRLLSFAVNDSSLVERVELIDISVTMIASHPLFGVGLYNFLPYLASFMTTSISSQSLQPVHNTIFLLVSEIGLVGFIFVAWFGISYASPVLSERAFRVKKYLVFIFLLLGFVDHYFLTLQQGQLLTVLIWSMILAKTE